MASPALFIVKANGAPCSSGHRRTARCDDVDNIPWVHSLERSTWQYSLDRQARLCFTCKKAKIHGFLACEADTCLPIETSIPGQYVEVRMVGTSSQQQNAKVMDESMLGQAQLHRLTRRVVSVGPDPFEAEQYHPILADKFDDDGELDTFSSRRIAQQVDQLAQHVTFLTFEDDAEMLRQTPIF
ncbi:hypothetical protein PsorP6_011166 [Peronosclerospora sorghi]|uniref:Uncharacterized protein n=1 Tax=Peronosclerospora sorghi TaxID=230839 RepID=A0ACC0VWS3_9STRA|nr:hypothetical protein PsorP6_011166 [Peronosclerospora sorghi]